MRLKYYKSGNVDNTFLGFLLAAAVAMFAVISNAREGLFETLVCNILLALAETLLDFSRKLPSVSACKVLSETVKDFFY